MAAFFCLFHGPSLTYFYDIHFDFTNPENIIEYIALLVSSSQWLFFALLAKSPAPTMIFINTGLCGAVHRAELTRASLCRLGEPNLAARCLWQSSGSLFKAPRMD